MIESFSEMLTEQMYKNGLIEEDDKEIYSYTVIVLIEKIIGFSMIFVISIIWNIFIPTLLFTLFYSGIRKYTGGYHAKKYQYCFLGTVGIFITYVKIIYPYLVKHMWVNYFCLVLAIAFIFIVGAVNHPDMDWSEQELYGSRRNARMAILTESCLLIIGIYFGIAEQYILFISYAIILCACCMALGKMTGQEVKEYEREYEK